MAAAAARLRARLVPARLAGRRVARARRRGAGAGVRGAREPPGAPPTRTRCATRCARARPPPLARRNCWRPPASATRARAGPQRGEERRRARAGGATRPSGPRPRRARAAAPGRVQGLHTEVEEAELDRMHTEAELDATGDALERERARARSRARLERGGGGGGGRDDCPPSATAAAAAAASPAPPHAPAGPVDWRGALATFYRAHGLHDKLAHVDAIVAQWRGDEVSMLLAVHRRNGVDPPAWLLARARRRGRGGRRAARPLLRRAAVGRRARAPGRARAARLVSSGRGARVLPPSVVELWARGGRGRPRPTSPVGTTAFHAQWRARATKQSRTCPKALEVPRRRWPASDVLESVGDGDREPDDDTDVRLSRLSSRRTCPMSASTNPIRSCPRLRAGRRGAHRRKPRCRSKR